MGRRSKRKARAVAEYARKQGWDVVLLTELNAEGEGVVWMGDEDHRVVLVHSKKAGVLLRGDMMKAWIEEGMLQKMDARQLDELLADLLKKIKKSDLTKTFRALGWNGREK